MTTPEATKRARYAKRVGARHESDIRDYLRDLGFDTEPLKLKGAEDEGDLVVRLGRRYIVIEAKNEKAINLAGYVAEASIEAVNFADHRKLSRSFVFPVSIVKARGKNVDRAYAVMEMLDFARLLDELQDQS